MPVAIGCASSRVLGRAGLVLAWGGTGNQGGGWVGGPQRLAKGVQRPAKGAQRPAKACKGMQRLAKACKSVQKACKGLQRPAEACKALQRFYKPINIPFVLENPAMAKCPKQKERKVFEL